MAKNLDVILLADSTDLPKQHCPNCGQRIEAASSEHGSLPQPGDINVCLYCGELLTFNPDMTIRRPTPEEIAEYKKQPGLWDEITSYQRRFRRAAEAIAVDLRPKGKPQ
jgi:hypothetical protein